MSWFSRLWSGRTQRESPYGWLSYRLNLRVIYDDLVEKDPSRADERIEHLFRVTDYGADDNRPEFDKQWSLLNEIELKLFRKMDDAQIRARIKQRFNSAEKEGVEDVALRREQFEATLDPERTEPPAELEATRRSIAIALLEDLFVKYSYRFAKRTKRAEVSARLTRIGLLLIGLPTVLVFFWPMLDFLVSFAEPDRAASAVGAAAGAIGAPSPAPAAETGGGLGAMLRGLASAIDGLLESRWASQEYAAFFVVMYFGLVGAYFSRIFVFARDVSVLSWRDMDVLYSRGTLWVRFLVGAIAAVIIFFLMMGDILSGALFLNGEFTLWVTGDASCEPAGQPCPMVPLRPTQDFARLIVWCSLAGFSERFLPNRLGELEESAKGSGSASDG